MINLNSNPAWRHIVGTEKPDPRMRDTEFLLRALALADSSDGFSGSMANFINNYCVKAKKFSDKDAQTAHHKLTGFFELFSDTPSPFLRAGKFSGVLFESAYAAWQQIGRPSSDHQKIAEAISEAKKTEEFAETLQEGSTKPTNTRKRIGLLHSYIEGVM